MSPMKPDRSKSKRNPHLADTLSLTQLARRWNVSPHEVRQLLGRQLLNFVQVRGRFRVPLTEIRQYEQSKQG